MNGVKGVHIHVEDRKQRNVPSGMSDLLEQLVVAAGIDNGVWSARILARAPGDSLAQGLPGAKVKGVMRRDITLVLQPGDNGTCRQLALRVPPGFKPADVQQRLRRAVDGSAAAELPITAAASQDCNDEKVVHSLLALFERREIGDLFTFIGMLPALMLEVEVSHGVKQYRLNVRDASELLNEAELDLFFEFLIDHHVLVPVGTCTSNYRNCVFELSFEHHGRLVSTIARVVEDAQGTDADVPSTGVSLPLEAPTVPVPQAEASRGTVSDVSQAAVSEADAATVHDDASSEVVASSSEDTAEEALTGIWFERAQMVYRLSGGNKFTGRDTHVWSNLSERSKWEVRKRMRMAGCLETSGDQNQNMEYSWPAEAHRRLGTTEPTQVDWIDKPALEGIWLERGQMVYELSGGKNFTALDQHVWGSLSRNQKRIVTGYMRAGGYLRTTGNTLKTEYIWLPRGYAELPRTSSGTDQEPIAATLEPSASPVVTPVTDEPLNPPPVSEDVSQPPLGGFDVHLPEDRLSEIAESMTTAALSSVRGSLAERSEELSSELARLNAADRVISRVLELRETQLRLAREALDNLPPELRIQLLKQYEE